MHVRQQAVIYYYSMMTLWKLVLELNFLKAAVYVYGLIVGSGLR